MKDMKMHERFNKNHHIHDNSTSIYRSSRYNDVLSDGRSNIGVECSDNNGKNVAVNKDSACNNNRHCISNNTIINNSGYNDEDIIEILLHSGDVLIILVPRGMVTKYTVYVQVQLYVFMFAAVSL